MTGSDILTRILDEVPDADPSDFLVKTNACIRKVADFGGGRWSWLAAVYQLDTNENYSTGTVSLTHGDATVTGIGTTFTSAMVGRRFRVAGYPGTFVYTTHTSGTSFEMDRTWARDSVTDKPFVIFTDTYPLPDDFRALIGVRDMYGGRILEEQTMRASLIRAYNGGGTGESNVQRFMLVGDDLVLLGGPVTPTTLQMWYWRRPAVLEKVGDIPDLPEHMHDVLVECLLYEYMDRTWGTQSVELYAPKIARQQARYVTALNDARIEDRTRSNPVHQFQRVLF